MFIPAMLFRPITALAAASALIPSANAGLLDGIVGGIVNPIAGVVNPILNPITGPIVNPIVGGVTDALGLKLDLGLFQGGRLINLDAFAGLLSSTTCNSPQQTIGVGIDLGNLARICLCVDILNPGGAPNPNACPACPANARPICGGAACGCECLDGFYADPTTSMCIPINQCQPPFVLVSNDGGITTQCQCPVGQYREGNTCRPNTDCQPPAGTITNGVCNCAAGYTKVGGVCTPTTASARARMSRKMKKNVIPAHPHAARAGHQQILAPKISASEPAAASVAVSDDKPSCPTGETACALPKGGFECLDTSSSLMSCGGCVGPSLAGINCLAIPGALSVECHVGKCQVASCFKGWRFLGGRCV